MPPEQQHEGGTVLGLRAGSRAAGSPEEPLAQQHGPGVKTCTGRPLPGLAAP